jgi:rhomboid protease GluP
MTLEIFIWGLANIVVIVAVLGCTILLYRFSFQKTKSPPPVAAMLIIGVTVLITGLQFIFPEVLTEFRRNREALLAGEWWRMVTPLFVQAHGWWQCCLNGVGAIFLCPLAERFYGKRLLALYFVPGILGEIFGYLWSPNGAGSSLGLAGVIGSLFTFAFLHHQEISKAAPIFVIFGIAGAVALCFSRDTHGPPMLIGVLSASMMTMLWPNKSLQATATALVS